MDLLLHKLVGVLQQLRSDDDHAGGAITNLLVLGHGDIDEDPSSRIVHIDGFENSSSVICDSDLLARLLVTHRLEDFVHTFRAQSRLNQV